MTETTPIKKRNGLQSAKRPDPPLASGPGLGATRAWFLGNPTGHVMPDTTLSQKSVGRVAAEPQAIENRLIN